VVNNILKKLTIVRILIFAFIIRLLLLPWAYHGDVTVTYWWGKFATEFGWRGYYDWLNFGGYGRHDQPMLNIYYDWAIRQLYFLIYNIFWFLNTNIPAFPSKFMQWYFEYGNQILLKLPMIFADIFIIYFVYKFIDQQFNKYMAKIVAIILTMYLPLIYNSAVWGSGDSVINLFALLSIYFLWHKKYSISALLFLTSVLYKSSLLIWSPIILIMVLQNKPYIKSILTTLIVSCIFLYLICFPFVPLNSNVFVWFFQTMTTKILPGAMQQITVNAMNFWAIIYGLLPQRLDEQTLFNTINHRQLSIIICSLLYLFISIKLYKNYTIENLLLSLVNITMVTFMFMTRMHERYTFPTLIPLLILCFYNKKYINIFIILSITHLLNVYNWWWVPSMPLLIYILKLDLVIRMISIINLIIIFTLLRYQYLSNLKTHQVDP
jgi:Gpi18-like mannosyltransferase